ncbi:MAG: antitoxin [Trueperaceae bacterium]|nr:antitoxin [Trueperaceae bacterium]
MSQEKISVSVPSSLARFLEEYRDAHELRTKSSVVERALKVLRERELEQAYADASRDVDSAWEPTTADGLSEDAW